MKPDVSTLAALPERRGDYFLPQEKATLLPATLLTSAAKTAVDFVADHQKTQQGSFGARAPVNGLDECLIQVMLTEPPVAAFLRGLPPTTVRNIFARLPWCKSGSVGVQSNDLAAFIHEYE